MSDYHRMFERCKNLNPGGETLSIDGDMRHYYLQRDQKFKPHIVENTDHPVKVGQFVTCDPFLSGYLGVQIGIVSGIRTFRERKSIPAMRQIELAGLPCRWFPIGQFEEFAYRYGKYSISHWHERVYVIGA